MLAEVKEVCERLKAIQKLNDRVAFSHFSTNPPLPFVVYNFSARTDGADDFHNMHRIEVSIELYQEQRDFALEKEIFSAFIDYPVQSYNDYIDSEKMFLTEFSFEFIEKN